MTAGNQEVVGQISKALQATLDQNETVRKQAESFLQQHELSPGFLSLLLGIVSNSSEQDVNITAAIYLKNAITRNWKEDHCNFNQKDCEYVYTNLVKALVGANSGVKKQILTLTVHLSDFTRANQWGFFKDFCALVEKGANENNYQILDTGLGKWSNEKRLSALVKNQRMPVTEMYQRKEEKPQARLMKHFREFFQNL